MDPSTIPVRVDTLDAGLMFDAGMEAAGQAGAAVVAPFTSSNPLDHLGPLLFTAFVAGSAKSIEIGIDDEKIRVVREAVENSDRFYRVTGMGVNSKATDATGASRAFKAVAEVGIHEGGLCS